MKSDFDTFLLAVEGPNEAANILKQCRSSFGNRGVDWDFSFSVKSMSIIFSLKPGSKPNMILQLKYGEKLKQRK